MLALTLAFCTARCWSARKTFFQWPSYEFTSGTGYDFTHGSDLLRVFSSTARFCETSETSHTHLPPSEQIHKRVAYDVVAAVTHELLSELVAPLLPLHSRIARVQVRLLRDSRDGRLSGALEPSVHVVVVLVLNHTFAFMLFGAREV